MLCSGKGLAMAESGRRCLNWLSRPNLGPCPRSGNTHPPSRPRPAAHRLTLVPLRGLLAAKAEQRVRGLRGGQRGQHRGRRQARLTPGHRLLLLLMGHGEHRAAVGAGGTPGEPAAGRDSGITQQMLTRRGYITIVALRRNSQHNRAAGPGCSWRVQLTSPPGSSWSLQKPAASRWLFD